MSAEVLRKAADRAPMVIDPLAVGIATATWLEATADRIGGKTWTGSRQALAVARAILEEDDR